MHSIETLDGHDPRVGEICDRIQGTWRCGSDGERPHDSEIVVVATATDGDVGIAALTPPGSAGWSPPAVVGIWVVPEARGAGLGALLIHALAAACWERFGGPALVRASEPGLYRIASAARGLGAELVVEARDSIWLTSEREIPRLRNRVYAWARAAGFSQIEAEDLKLNADELLTNGVRHGAPLGEGAAVELEVRIDQTEFAQSVTNLPDLPRDWSTSMEHGRGLRIVAERSAALTCTFTTKTALPSRG